MEFKKVNFWPKDTWMAVGLISKLFVHFLNIKLFH